MPTPAEQTADERAAPEASTVWLIWKSAERGEGLCPIAAFGTYEAAKAWQRLNSTDYPMSQMPVYGPDYQPPVWFNSDAVFRQLANPRS